MAKEKKANDKELPVEEDEKVTSRTINFGNMTWGERTKWATKALLGLKEIAPASLAFTRPEDIGFRRITQRSDKELKPSQWQKQLAVAHFLWLQNPMAARLLEIMSDFVIGDGFTWEAPDEEVSKVLTKHWNDPDNNWDLLQFERYQELILFGTWAPRVFVNKHNGHVKLGPVDPSWIADIFPDANIAGKAVAIKIQRSHEGSLQGPGETFRVIAEDTRVLMKDPVTGKIEANPSEGLLVGDIFYFTVNKLTFLLQGISDLFRIADWVDAFDQFIFSLLERVNFLNAHLWDITLEGAEQKEINERAAELAANPPKPGSSRIHNEKEKWDAVAPKINSAEIEEVAGIIKMLILGSMGIPEHWFGEGGNTNLATAAEMGGPIHRKLKRKQGQWKAIVRTILQFQVDKAIEAGRLTKIIPEGLPKAGESRDLSFEVISPEVSSKNLKEFVEALDKATSALSTAVAEGFIKQAKAAKVWTKLAQELGVEIEAPDEEEVEQNNKDLEAAVNKKVEQNQVEAITPAPANGTKATPPAKEAAKA